jgi:hypothetical protein
VFFSSFIIKIPSPQRDGALKKKERERERNIEKEEGKRKALRVSANKNGELTF